MFYFLLSLKNKKYLFPIKSGSSNIIHPLTHRIFQSFFDPFHHFATTQFPIRTHYICTFLSKDLLFNKIIRFSICYLDVEDRKNI